MSKYDIKSTKKLKFARFGGLSSVNQRGYDSSDTNFHAPPSSRGFYAFVWPYYELFLLGANCTKNPKTIGSKFSYVRDSSGKIVDSNHPDYEKLDSIDNSWSIETPEYSNFCKDNEKLIDDDYDLFTKLQDDMFGPGKLAQYVMVKKPKPRIFEYTGHVWHHLGGHLKQHLIISSKGSWVKTDMESYRFALEREMHHAQKKAMSWCYKYSKFIPTPKSAMHMQVRDHLEVFIEKI